MTRGHDALQIRIRYPTSGLRRGWRFYHSKLYIIFFPRFQARLKDFSEITSLRINMTLSSAQGKSSSGMTMLSSETVILNFDDFCRHRVQPSTTQTDTFDFPIKRDLSLVFYWKSRTQSALLIKNRTTQVHYTTTPPTATSHCSAFLFLAVYVCGSSNVVVSLSLVRLPTFAYIYVFTVDVLQYSARFYSRTVKKTQNIWDSASLELTPNRVAKFFRSVHGIRMYTYLAAA